MRDGGGVDAASLPGDEERALLRDSLRGFLAEHWPAEHAIARGREPEAIARVWSGLAEQGLAGLGSEPTEGGLRELALAMEELGRAACPALLLGAGLVNLALAGSDAPQPAKELLAQLHGGGARVCWSFGELDPSAGAAELTWSGERISGTLRFVDGAAAATHLVVVRSGGRPGLAIVALHRHEGRDPSTIVATRALGADGWAEILLGNAPAAFVPLDNALLADLLRVARLALLARAHGAARRAFEMAVDYAKERKQFGQPIGRFQAVQHKLANNLIALEGVRVTLEHAAEAVDLGRAVLALLRRRGSGVRRPGPAPGGARDAACLRRHRLRRGARGAAPLPPRPSRHPGARRCRRGAARPRRAPARRPPTAPCPRYDLGAAGNAFRAEVRAWLDSTGAASARRRSIARTSTSASSTRRSRATSAVPAGSASAGRASSAARRARRSSRSPSWR